MTDTNTPTPEAVAAALEGVTPGPWRETSTEEQCVFDDDGLPVAFYVKPENARFIAWARNNVEAIAADRDAQKARADAAEALAEERLQGQHSLSHQLNDTARELNAALAAAEAKVAKLEAAADYILDGMGIDAPDYEIDPDDDFLDAANSEWVRDVLTRLAAALRGDDHV